MVCSIKFDFFPNLWYNIYRKRIGEKLCHFVEYVNKR
jgi:hypothetical protein